MRMAKPKMDPNMDAPNVQPVLRPRYTLQQTRQRTRARPSKGEHALARGDDGAQGTADKDGAERELLLGERVRVDGEGVVRPQVEQPDGLLYIEGGVY